MEKRTKKLKDLEKEMEKIRKEPPMNHFMKGLNAGVDKGREEMKKEVEEMLDSIKYHISLMELIKQKLKEL